LMRVFPMNALFLNGPLPGHTEELLQPQNRRRFWGFIF
jgi:hypothetical protein